MRRPQDPLPRERGPYLHLLTVYLIWGSTFVAMRAAVMNHSGFQPFSVGASRLGVASLFLFGWAFLRRVSVKVRKQDLLVLAASGILIWVCGNGFVMWAEQWVESGYATLVFSTLPLWTLFLGCVLEKKRPSLRLILSFVAALLGMAILGGKNLVNRESDLFLPTLVIVLSTFLWSISTHLQKRRPVSCPMFVASAYQQLFGALGCSAVMLWSGEALPHPTPTAWIAWGYLVVFGSIIAYSSYITVVQRFPPSISMTFAYVCPVVTVILGYLVLGESITANKLIGMAIILGSVYVIFRGEKKSRLISG